jgi:ABC-type transporter Mla maintaining outer membrane lipid asymmetry permease subunit MlaE
MFYEPKDGPQDMAVDPFKNLVVPRPIGWVTSLVPFDLFGSSAYGGGRFGSMVSKRFNHCVHWIRL